MVPFCIKEYGKIYIILKKLLFAFLNMAYIEKSLTNWKKMFSKCHTRNTEWPCYV